MRIVLDVDGVFLRERPYWRTALATALSLIGADGAGNETFRRLDREFFDKRAVQRIIKAVGINSNWHLCGALVCCLPTQSRRDEVLEALSRADIGAAADRWNTALTEYLHLLADQRDRSGSPVDYLSREPLFAPVVSRFQSVFRGQDGRFDIEPNYETLGDPAVIRGTFDRLRRGGAVLAICTGRNLPETVEPLLEFGLFDEPFDECIVTHDDVERAEAATGLHALSKPHWFPLAAAICGFEVALDALRGTRSLRGLFGERVVFVGDGVADFHSAGNCRERGGDVEFVLVRSGALAPETAAQIRKAAFTLGVVPRFEAVPHLLEEAAP